MTQAVVDALLAAAAKAAAAAPADTVDAAQKLVADLSALAAEAGLNG